MLNLLYVSIKEGILKHSIPNDSSIGLKSYSEVLSKSKHEKSCHSQRKMKDVLKATYFLVRVLITFSYVMSTLPQEIECLITLCVLSKSSLFALCFETFSGQ